MKLNKRDIGFNGPFDGGVGTANAQGHFHVHDADDLGDAFSTLAKVGAFSPQGCRLSAQWASLGDSW